MTQSLRDVHKDVHLHVLCGTSFDRINASQLGGDETKRTDFGFETVELDTENEISYIRSKGVWTDDEETYRFATDAMGMAAHSKYVILDIRDNPGGSGGVGRFLASYFFAAGDEQYYLYGFEKDRTKSQQEWTYPYVPGHRLVDAKVFILVNKGTGSASEGFAFAMQHLKRATIIGEATAGAGIAGEFLHLPYKMVAFVPKKMVVAPYTDKGWEGIGVIPDVVTTPGEERARALELIEQDRKKATPVNTQ